jgi:endonuclease/exonuclease/phosphatase (EEP) superfamily protein YafD
MLQRVTVLIVLGSVLNLLPTYSYLQEININLGAYYLGAHLLLFLLWLPYLRDSCWRRVVLILGFQLVFLWSYWHPISGFYHQAKTADFSPLLAQRAYSRRGIGPGSATLKVLVANAYLRNVELVELADALVAQEADILIITEYVRTLRETPLLEKYAYHKIVSGFGTHDIAIFSKYPWREPPITSVSSEGELLPPILFVRVEAPIPVIIVGLHLLPPLWQEALESNQLLIRRVALMLRHEDSPKIVLGDINATPFSRAYGRLTNGARLENAFTELGYHSTWHTQRPWQRFMIDHIFYGGGLWRESAERFELPGSDHFGLVATFRSMPEDPASKALRESPQTLK